MRHPERHRTHRVGWLRAAVLGANDGIVSTASLVVVVVAGANAQAILVAGAMSMAAGEYASVSSQSDTEVATQLMRHDALGAHARDELGISDTLAARPVQAALASAATFAVGAALPLLVVLLAPASTLLWAVAGSSLLFLALLGALSGRVGGAPMGAATLRVTFWGALAMALTAGVGALFGVAA